MALEIDFVPFGTGAGANVTAQSTYVAETTTSTGFQSGVASSADCNKAWRQGTVMAAAVANFIGNELSANVLDNGDLATLTTQLTDAVTTNATAAATTVVNSALGSFTIPFLRVTGQIASAQVPQAAVTQYQSQLQIAGSQISGAITVSATITATGFNVSSDLTLKSDVKPITGALGRLDLYRGITYRLKGSDEIHGGFGAQDFAKACPHGVKVGKGGKLEIKAMAVVAELAEALRDARDLIRGLEARVAMLEGRP